MPPRLDGSKAPLVEWKQFMHKRANDDQLFIWYNRTMQTGVGLVCGKISGNLEMLELEGRATDGDSLDKIWEMCVAMDASDIWTRLCDGYMERTPSGGIHFLYRIDNGDGSEATVPGNTKIARRPATAEELAENPLDKIKTLSETRGEGGYVIVAPSHGSVHPSGESWDMISGEPGNVITLTWFERCRLHQAIHAALDEMPDPVATEPRPVRPTIPGEKRPGDDFNESVRWSDLLLPRGWTLVYKKGDKWHWRRPGKNVGISATTSDATGRLWVFSSSTEFEPEKHYSKFEAYTLLEHHGDFSAAARELSRQGLGTRHDPYTSGVLVPAVSASLPMPGDVSVPQAPQAALANRSPTSITQWDTHGVPVYQPGVFKYMPKWNQTDMAEMWANLHENTFRYVGSDKTWMRWDGVTWVPSDGERHVHAATAMVKRLLDYAETAGEEGSELRKSLIKEAKRVNTPSGVSGIVTLGRAHPDISSTWSEFDKKRNLITLENGTLDLDTFELQPHSHCDMLTRKVNASYDPDAKEGRFTQFMEEVLPDQEVREYLQRICGYALTGQADERVLVQLYGPSGTGKSQFTKAIFSVMGDFARRASESAFQTRPNSYKGPSEDLHSLMGSRFAVLPELDEGFRLNVSLVKALTGGDNLTTRRLYGQEVTWRPEYTIFMITNHLPRVGAGEDAYWNRVKPIKFSQVFVDSNGETLHPQDRNLGERMAQEEPQVILNWLLEGLRKYRERGLDAPQQVTQWRDDYRDDVDTVGQFLKEAPQEGRITIDADEKVTVRILHRTYQAWCADNHIPAVGMGKFNERMDSRGFERHKREKGITWDGIGITGFIGESTTPAAGASSYRGMGHSRWNE